MAAASANATDAVHCVGYQTLIVRSAEWAATGTVTIALPERSPTADKASVVEPGKVKWPVTQLLNICRERQVSPSSK